MSANRAKPTTAKGVEALAKPGAKPGRYSAGGGLYLVVGAGEARSWVFMTDTGGKRLTIGLGGLRDVSLKLAGEKATAFRLKLAKGEPLRAVAPETDVQPKKAPTFGEAADAYIESREAGWRNAKHAAQWRMTLGPAYCAAICRLPVDRVNTDAVLTALKAVWTAKPETATRLRARIEAVLDYARVRGWREGENPARWKGHLEHAGLAARKKEARGHHAALPYADMPVFMASLRAMPGVGARCAEFTILTASRSGEARGARWPEFRLSDRLWVIPAERMKAGKEHRVPLSDRALEILSRIAVATGADPGSSELLVFPGQAGAPLSDMTLTAVFKRMGRGDVTMHGFRSSFADWCSETTNFPREARELALAHAVGSKTEQAYARGDLFAKRIAVMDAWSAYCRPVDAAPAKVVRLRALVG